MKRSLATLSRCVPLVLYVAILAGVGFHIHRQLPLASYSSDESGWTRASIQLAERLVNRDLRPNSWEFYGSASFGNMNPHVGKLFFAATAISLMPRYGGELPPAPERYLIAKSRKENEAEGRVVPKDLLLPLRRSTLLVGLLLIAATMALIHSVFGLLSACVVGMLLGVNPQLIALSTRVLTDVHYMLFIVLTGVLGVWCAVSTTRPKALGWFFMASLVAGLASAVKLAAVFLLTPFLFGVAVTLSLRGLIGKWTGLGLLALSILLFLGVSFTLNPYLWPDLSRVSYEALDKEWHLLRRGEFSLPPGKEAPAWVSNLDHAVVVGPNRLSPMALSDLRQQMWNVAIGKASRKPHSDPRLILPAWYGLTRPVQLPLLYVRWNEYKKLLWTSPHWSPPAHSKLLEKISKFGTSFFAEGFFAVLGLCLVLHRSVSEFREQRLPGTITFLVFLMVVPAVVALTRLSDSDRYLFAFYLFRSILAGIAIAFLLSKIGSAIGRLQSRRLVGLHHHD